VIRLATPDVDDTDIAAVVAVLRCGTLVQATRVREFERRAAAVIGAAEAVAVSNCTSALQLALLAIGVGPGDRVAVPSFSWPATANVVVLCGAEPVFVDIERETNGMDPDALEAAFATHDRIKAVLPVHAFGAMARMSAITTLAARHGAFVIEDAACALGAEREGRGAGTWGGIGCFSFHPRKAVTTGEGGVAVTADAAIARRIRALRNHGLDPDSATPEFIAPGYNMRLTEFQAALGLTQLAKLDRILEHRRRLARRYTELLAGAPVVTPAEPPGVRHVFQSYVVLLPCDLAPRRASLIATLRGRGVETTIGTHHLPLTTYFRQRYRYRPGDFPVTDDVFSRALTLPLHTGLAESDQVTVAEALRAAL